MQFYPGIRNAMQPSYYGAFTELRKEIISRLCKSAYLKQWNCSDEDDAKGEMTLASMEEVVNREEDSDEITDYQKVALAYVPDRASKMIARFNFEGAFFLAPNAQQVSLAPWICNHIDKPLAEISLTVLVLLSLFHQLVAQIHIDIDKGLVRLIYMRHVVELIKGEPMMFKSIQMC
ncbi:unnamed protein product [Microthlaspi erraticum]|uniref:Uncharacterized protein n=1 Tax=Microthlaspi erraticum TaxID=1685480 RepID=A0A6D2JTR5_9BRAS|nr:unnamed protein product [Microthlaspi erraticum]